MRKYYTESTNGPNRERDFPSVSRPNRDSGERESTISGFPPLGWLRPRSRVHADVVERGFWRVRRNVFLSSGQLGWSLGYVILRLAAATPAAAAILA